MAALTVVITYNAASGEVSPRVTSLTSGGTAYASITAANLRLTQDLLEKAAKMMNDARGQSATESALEHAGGR